MSFVTGRPQSVIFNSIYQNSILRVILLKAKSNRVGDLVVLLPELLQAIPSAPKGGSK